MRILIPLLCCLSSLASVLAQDISSQIKDSKKQLPIQYVNIGVVGKNIGTVSDALGNFQLSLENALDTDTLRISIITYKPKNYKIGGLRASKFPNTILMDEKIVELNEVVIRNQNRKVIQLGLKKKYCYPIPLYRGVSSNISFPQKGYRHEIGTRFINSKIIKLDSIQLNFIECTIDNFQIRLNVYSIKNEIIKNILNQPIYISLTKEEALNFPIINLKKYHIEIDSDFLITVENHIQLPNNVLHILANFKSKGRIYPTYYRESSQSNWIKLKSKKSKVIGLSLLAFAHLN